MIGNRWILLTLFVWASSAHAFIDPPVITPEDPTTETIIEVSIRYGVCDALVNYTVETIGTAVELRITKILTQGDPFCNVPVTTTVFDLPLLSSGTHALTIYLQDVYPPGAQPFVWFQTTLHVINAGGTAPTPVPTLAGWIPVALLLSGILILVARRYARVAGRQFGSLVPIGLALIGLSQEARASTWIEVLLSGDAGAPTAEDVVEWAARGSPDAPPLASLEVASFKRVELLIPEATRARGDFKELLDRFPNSPAAQLQRFIVVEYPDVIAIDYVLAALRADRHVLAAAVMETYEAQSAELISFGVGDPQGSQAAQWHLSQLRIPTAWTYNPGHALVALLDLGLQWDHPNLRAFDGATFVGGNFLPVSSLDFAYPPSDSFLVDEVDEKKPIPATDPACDRGEMMIPGRAGHGTHTSGLMAAHSEAPGGVSGVCQHCGLYMMKVGYYECLPFQSPPYAYTTIASLVVPAAATAAIQVGAQVVNMSIHSTVADFCDDPTQKLRSSCLVLDIAASRDTLFVSSSGNRREALRFPASHPYVVAAGGVFENGDFWDESPGFPINEDDCPNEYPYVSPPESCGSNFSQTSSAPRQELVAGARDVLSTFYTGAEWNRAIRCTDESHDVGTPNNGISLCSGTSMSSPIIAGVFGILRSTNPLVKVGEPLDSSPKGLRYVVATTTDRAQQSLA